MSGAQLSPPWYTLQRKLTYTVGTFGGVFVSPLMPDGNDYTITIQTMNHQMAEGLVNTLTLSYDFGPSVTILVKDETGAIVAPSTAAPTPEELEQWLRAGLAGNPYFYGVESWGHPGHPPVTYLVLAPQVIQFYNDNYSDPQAFDHYVAQDVFAEVFRNEYPGSVSLNFTTAAPAAGF